MSSRDGFTGSGKQGGRASTVRALLSLCPYTHIWRAGMRAVSERKLPGSARTGAMVALLGLFCPFFWIALFTGASRGEMLFHATHSGVVIMLGVIMMLAALAKEGGGR